MGGPYRFFVALCLLLATPAVVTGTGFLAFVSPGAQFAEPESTGLQVVRVVPPQDALVPGGSRRETFSISTQVDALYAFTLRLSTGGHDPDGLTVVIEDVDGRPLYDGRASGASFAGRELIAGVTDVITIWISLHDDEGIQPGATVDETWTVTAQSR